MLQTPTVNMEKGSIWDEVEEAVHTLKEPNHQESITSQ